MRKLYWLAPVAFMATGACFATREDVQVLQDDLARYRAEQAQSDSLMRQHIAQLAMLMTSVDDSVGSLSGRLVRMQGDVRGDLYALSQQLLQVQELTGQSQRRLQEMRASLEARGQEIAAENTAPQGQAPTPSPAAQPGPNQLFQLSLDQLRRGSAGAARSGFEQLVREHPNSDLVPDAWFYLAEAHSMEGNTAQADSAYATVVSRYPRSPRASTALYKRALLLEAHGDATAARTLLNQVIERYPRSDEAALARERLRPS
jgi:tol-pal system protein YbgF